MSEKRAKQRKKDSVDVKKVRHVDRSSILMNTIVTVVILAVLGLGVYAVGSKYMERRAAEGGNAEQQQTVADFIKEKGMTFDEFKTEYGLADDEEISEEMTMSQVSGKLTLENYAKYADTTTEELKAQYGLGEDVPNTTVWQDAISYMTTGVVAQNFFGSDFETFKTQMNVPDTITADTPWRETQAIMEEISRQAAENQETPDAQSEQTDADAPAADEALGE